MKAKEVMQILRISNPTLSTYVKKGWIKVTKMPNGRYIYDEDSVYEFLNKGIPRKVYIYGRVSSSSQKKELESQMEMLKQFCFSNGIKIDGVFQDVASGISFEKRKEFFRIDMDTLEHLVNDKDPAAEFTRTALAEQYRQSISLETAGIESIPEESDDSSTDEDT